MVLPAGMNQNLWLSSVLPISEEEFIRYSEGISDEIIAARDSEDDNPPPIKIE
jgi:hypothetical protein